MTLPNRYCMYYVTDWCNAECSFCNIWRNDILKVQPIEKVAENIRDLKRLGAAFIDFTGGEPFMRRDLPSVLELAEEAKIPYGWTNNGSLFLKRFREIRHLNPFAFNFSLDSPVPEIHNAHRKLPNNWHTVVKSLDVCVANGWHPSVIYTVTSWNYDGIDAMIRLVRDHRCHLILNPVFAYGTVGERDSLSREQLLSLKPYINDSYVSVDPRQIDFLFAGGNDPQNRTCRSMDTHVVVAPDGALYTPCYHYSNYRFPTPDGIYEAVKSEKWRNLAKQAGTYDFCNNCSIYCYMDASLFFNHPIIGIFTLLAHLVKIRTKHDPLPEQIAALNAALADGN